MRWTILVAICNAVGTGNLKRVANALDVVEEKVHDGAMFVRRYRLLISRVVFEMEVSNALYTSSIEEDYYDPERHH